MKKSLRHVLHAVPAIALTIGSTLALAQLVGGTSSKLSSPSPVFAASAAAASGVPGRPPFFEATPCAGDIAAEPGADDPDVSIVEGATLNVMFHGNRFVAAPELAAEFERLNPGQKVSWTALPPAKTHMVLRNGGNAFGKDRPFFPDVFMGAQSMVAALEQDANSGFIKRKYQMRGSYSRVHGMVLIARADDNRVTGTDAQAIIANRSLRIVIPGQQPLTHPLVKAYGAPEGTEPLHAMKDARFGVSQQRHHRSIPARILAKCEDVGVQYLQSQRYLEDRFPGKFKFIPMPLSDVDAAYEESYLFLFPGSKNAPAAEKFVAFMRGPEALRILTKYHLEP